MCGHMFEENIIIKLIIIYYYDYDGILYNPLVTCTEFYILQNCVDC